MEPNSATPRTIAPQVPLSMGFSRVAISFSRESSGLQIGHVSPVSPTLQAEALPLSPQVSPCCNGYYGIKWRAEGKYSSVMKKETSNYHTVSLILWNAFHAFQAF